VVEIANGSIYVTYPVNLLVSTIPGIGWFIRLAATGFQSPVVYLRNLRSCRVEPVLSARAVDVCTIIVDMCFGTLGEDRSVRQIIDELSYTAKVPLCCVLAKLKIGPRVKLHVVPKVKEQRPGDAYPVNYYDKKDWELIKIIVRVTVAEHGLESTERPTSPFTAEASSLGIFGCDSEGNIIVNNNKTTRTYLIPLLSFVGSSRFKQSFKCAPERDAYKQRIIDLMNAIWLPPVEAQEPLNLDAVPFVWCRHKTESIDKLIADLTEILRYRGEFDGTTLEEIAAEYGTSLDKAGRSAWHYALELTLGYSVHKRVLIPDTAGPREWKQWPNDDWPTIVLTQREARIIKSLHFCNTEPLDPPAEQAVVASCDNDGCVGHPGKHGSHATPEWVLSSKRARLS
jgi:hypothetical protein